MSGLSRAERVKVLQNVKGLSDRQARRAYAQYFEKPIKHTVPEITPESEDKEDAIPAGQGAHMSFAGDAGQVDLVSASPRTLDDLLKACCVDTQVWEVEKYVVNKWEMGRKAKIVNMTYTDGVANGSISDSGEITKAPLWQIKAWLRRKVEASTINKMLEQFTEKASKYAPTAFLYEKPKKAKSDCCYVLNGHDLHIAKLAWGPSTGGADWDIKIARETDDAAVNDLMAKAPLDRIEEVIVIVGSDMLQIDNDKSTTTAGTYVDSDSRLMKAFEAAGDMLTSRIEKLASRFKVKAVVIPGNHDSTVSLFLGKYIEAWFRNHPNVTVDSTPKSRKYHAFGKNLIGFDHGSNTKLNELPLLMMRENQSTISAFKHLEFLTGDKHHEFVNDIKGIRVRIAPALCPPDKWHADKGYIGSVRQSQGLLYQIDNGLEAIYYSTPLQD